MPLQRFLTVCPQIVITPLFWFVQGTFYTAIFVVGHDAGHGSFSSSELVNTICGTICHTFVMCPYYMWKLSHRHHHKNTGNIDKDEVFYPVRKSQDPNVKVLLPGFGLGIGWFVYLLQGYRPKGVEHFNLWFPMFKHHMFQCALSLISLVTWCVVLNAVRQSFGLGFVLYYHAVPVFIFGSYIVIITFLHHSEEGVPWYGNDVWDNVRGQLSSIDRSYGWCHSILHNISTHQIHHLFPKVPHYHLEEATTHFRKEFPSLVRVNNEAVMTSFWRMFKKYSSQNIVDDKAAVYFYK
ncbi:omega-3 fatty acid desaturase, endoplasmic reticulum [Plakobranchus ocellatus]|uniref:Omega-3 fatty acid desaturase, endoplasmic reticulum n=1 Tax=Plakobranchus ocellatus TaxID=259542 RepID=A0AAV4CVD8_9GAST|nr:omega-3 fatty acid desaturase, endoplasmic reticulum [Plakobranchus ocellatus]